MTCHFTGEIWYWKGPAPHHFVTVPSKESAEIKEIAKLVSYGWGMIPVNVTLGETRYYTALWEKDGKYIVPIKAKVRKAENVDVGDLVALSLEIS